MARKAAARPADTARTRRIVFLMIGAPFMIAALIWYVWAAWTEGAAREWPTTTAGKTSLCRGVLQGLGFAGDVPSPTFPIVITYDPPEVRLPVWHVDLYRLEDPGELDELGLDDALGDAALLIEWPERLPFLWPETLRLSLEADRPGGRRLTATPPPAWERRWPPPPLTTR